MTEFLSLLAFVAIAAAVWFLIPGPPAVFIVRVRGGRAHAERGKVTQAFLAAVEEVCGVASGEVRGVARGKRISLWFSGGIPPAARQRLRNWWAASGWKGRS
jgi:hypothetical protein